ncbi:MAG: SUMF1/EgtB/PvdO family nonheme iron enzyme [Deltaproteobacteria bacterium]|nr:SUMF1/EgtB/PvdO family nonheme iron enzyme [Deltaproteobacteria bacterium]
MTPRSLVFAILACMEVACQGCGRADRAATTGQAHPSASSEKQPPVQPAPAASPSSTNASPASAADTPDSGVSESDAGLECPPEMARLSQTCIDRWEATLVSRDDAGTEVAHPHFERPAAGVIYEARSVPGVFPQAYISRVEAAAACKQAGKRLCSMGEWQRGCQGRRWWTWPYGPQARAGKCNNAKPHLLSSMYGSNGQAWKYDEHFNSPALDQEPGFLAKTGEYDGCANEERIYDMVGNLHEWVRDSVDDALVEKLAQEDVERKPQPSRTGNGIFMGGFFSTTSEHGPGCKFTTIAHEPTYHDYSIGFRCCRSIPKAKRPGK